MVIHLGYMIISLSCTVDFCIKITEPYTKKYISLLLLITFFRKQPQIVNCSEDYNVLYGENGEEYNDEINNDNTKINLGEKLVNKSNILTNSKNSLNSSFKGNNANNINNRRRPKMFMFEMNELDQGEKLNSMANTVEIVTREMQTNDFYKSLLAIWLTTHHDSNYENDDFLKNNENSYLPWKEEHYAEKTPLMHFTNKTVNELFGPLDEIKDDLYFNVKIRKYSPKIFYVLRRIDNISTKDFLLSLSPKDNLKIIKESFASGGRSANPIIFTHDKKYLLKTISKSEKNVLLEMLPEYHRRMRDTKSLLCRIYGL